MVSLNLRSKVEDIYRIFRGKRVLVAFSGGVDSSLMVSLARDVAESVLAVTMNSQIIPLEEVERAKQVAGELCVNHMVVWIDMLRSPQFVANTPDRCYYCKKELSRYLKRVAYEQGYELIVEGTNASDILGYRPGFLALREEGILSPYLMVGITKEEIRLIAHEKGLSVYNQPSMACLSSRIPYGEIITEEKLSRIADAERFIKKLIGVEVIRVRSHGDIARITRSNFPSHNITMNLVQRVKPLCEVMERESALYAFIKRIPFQEMPCPYAGEALRNDVRNTLNRLEEKHPGSKYTIYRSMEKIQKAIETSVKGLPVKKCEKCGEITN
ncbi:MAG: ATP-dependent sacrificial sulfur transferase LarE, partial [Candidatus Jordarchaeaceae archaeon]